MTSLSNVIKPRQYITLQDKRRIKEPSISVNQPSALPNQQHAAADSLEQRKTAELLKLAENEKQTIIAEAKLKAQQIIEQAKSEADQLIEEAKQNIENWWEERRRDDEAEFAKVRETGYQTGLQEGRADAEKQIAEQYAEKLSHAEQIVTQAFEAKNKIIQEAEPFLLELSTQIAAKIINQQLTVDREWVLEGIKSVLKRRKEQGIVTLCVSPDHFEFVNDSKEELLLALDSDVDLQIVPDQRVQDHGCIVRSAYGSIDARIDTQLTEIKRVLIEIAASSGEVETN